MIMVNDFPVYTIHGSELEELAELTAIINGLIDNQRKVIETLDAKLIKLRAWGQKGTVTYDKVAEEHDGEVDNFNFNSKIFEEHMEKIKEEIKTIQIFSGTSKKPDKFDDSKHKLCVTKNKQGKWSFIYINKTDWCKFQKLMGNIAI